MPLARFGMGIWMMRAQKKNSEQSGDVLALLRQQFTVPIPDKTAGRMGLDHDRQQGLSPPGGLEAVPSVPVCSRREAVTQKNLQTVLDALPCRIFWKNLNSVYLGCNRAFAVDAGLESPGQIVGRCDHDLLWAEHSERYQADDRLVITTGQPRIGAEASRITPDGRKIWLRTNKVPFVDDEGCITGVLGTYEYITEQKKHEEECLRMEKLESLRVLAGGLAHDFNNLMTVILGSLSLALMDAKLSDKTYRVLKEAEKACLGSMQLTEQLMSSASTGTQFKKPESIPEILDDVVNTGLAGSPVRCEMMADKDIWTVHCNARQTHRALTNVIVNAKEAMQQGGVIKVAARNVQLQEGELPPLNGGRYVKVSVQDSGRGIPEDLLPRIFDPYFSTKERGTKKGMGLGLTITYAILKRHEGHVRVESQAGTGSIVHLYLPAC